MAGFKVHAGVNWVKLLTNALWLQNLVGRTPDPKILHCYRQRSCRGLGGVNHDRGQIAQKCLLASKYSRKNPQTESDALLESKVMWGQLVSTGDQTA